MTRRPDLAPAGRSVVRVGPTFDPRTGLVGLAAFGAFGLGVSALYAGTGVGLPCPFRVVTGWDCPLCGGTRLGGALLHGDLGAAFTANPLVLVGLAVLTALGVLWVLEAVGGPRVRLPERFATSLRRITPTAWTALAFGVAVVYAVARNLWFSI